MVYNGWCQRRGIVANDKNTAQTVARYFQDTWKEDVTEANLDAAFEQLRPYLKFYEAHEQEVTGLLSKLSPEEQRAFTEWRGPRGLKPTYRAMAALLSWLAAHKFAVTAKNLDLAVGQTRLQQFLEWNESATPRYEDARQHKSDDEPFLGRDVNLTPAQHRERARAAFAEPSKESVSAIRGREQAGAKQDAEGLRGRTHSETAQLQRVYVTNDRNEIDWVKTRDARRQMQQGFERRNAVTVRSYR